MSARGVPVVPLGGLLTFSAISVVFLLLLVTKKKEGKKMTGDGRMNFNIVFMNLTK